MKNRIKPVYYTNKKVRESIDKLLSKNALFQASLGTNSKSDLGEEGTKKAWKLMEQEIKKLDPLFYNIIKTQSDDLPNM